MAKTPWIADRNTALIGGTLFISAGALMLYDAFDRRGIHRPFWTRLLPGA